MFFALVVLLASQGAVHAQQTPPTPMPGEYQPVKEDFLMRVETLVDDKWVLLPDLEAERFFNKARCECDVPVAIRVELSQTGTAKKPLIRLPGTVQLWAGPAACVATDPNRRPAGMMGCTLIQELQPLPEIANNPQQVRTTVGKLFTAGSVPMGKACSVLFSQSLWLWVDYKKDGQPDIAEAPTLPIALDGEAPPAPAGVTVTPGNEALGVNWTRENQASEQNSYVVFCSRAGLPVFKESFYKATDFQTKQTACPGSTTATAALPELAFQISDTSKATPVNVPPEFQRLDPKYVCSELLTSATEWRIKILQNGIPYVVGVAAVDPRGNVSSIDIAYAQTPIPTRDFYDAYREAGGEAEGGFCAYGQRARPAGWALALLGTTLAVALGRLARRRRR